MSSENTIEDTKILFSYVLYNNWQAVLKMFEEKRELRTAKITETGDTVLHIAVYKQQVNVVEKMVDIVCGNKINEHNDVNEDGDERKLVFEAKNEKGNTPLHVAASLMLTTITLIGENHKRKRLEALMKRSHVMCEKIGCAYRGAIAMRNEAGETPLFLSALHGKRNTFLRLHDLYMDSHDGVSLSPTEFAHNCIRDNDDTILHCAIAEGHIDVAFEIVRLYKDCLKYMMRRNKEGLSPLHLQAAQPSTFASTWLREQPYYKRLYYMLVLNGRLALPDQPRIREKQNWSLQVMKELLLHASDDDMSQIISETASEYLSVSPQTENKDKEFKSGEIKIETPLMIATKNGVVEMVDGILNSFPSTIKSVNTEGKNIVLLAIEYRQWEVYRYLCRRKWQTGSLFEQVDKEGNNALHLAAMVESNMLNPEEINWFEWVKNSTPRGLLGKYNMKMETPEDIFEKNYMELMKNDAKWAVNAAQAFSVVSTLVATVAFATRSTVPGGYDNNTGYAILRHKSALFKVFSYCELLALAFSFISTLLFLSIATSAPQSFRMENEAQRLDGGMTYMFISIALLWISFCAGHYFTIDHKQHGKWDYAVLAYIFLSFFIFILFLDFLPKFVAPVLSRYKHDPKSKFKVTPPIEYRRTKNKESIMKMSLEEDSSS